jgi:hypothetical protein
MRETLHNLLVMFKFYACILPIGSSVTDLLYHPSMLVSVILQLISSVETDVKLVNYLIKLFCL